MRHCSHSWMTPLLAITALVTTVAIVMIVLTAAGTPASASPAPPHRPIPAPTPAEPPDYQSTTGPTPPPGLLSAGLAAAPSVTVTIPGVPDYNWRHGCGPTAAGMVIGYWDGQGYPALVQGDASTQTAAVNDMIASGVVSGTATNYGDYCWPLDWAPDPLEPDKSEDPPGDEHADHCVADYMKTSQSYYGNYYGWSYFSHVGPALVGYSRQTLGYGGGDLFILTENLYKMWWSQTLTWERLQTEIDAGRPMVFLVDTSADGGTDHFVTVVGYGTEGDTQYYGCLNTWDSNIHWFEFAEMANGQPWGIYGATTYNVLTLPEHVYLPLIAGGGGGAVGAESSDN